VSYTCFYNHARRLRLEKIWCIELSRSPSGYFNYALVMRFTNSYAPTLGLGLRLRLRLRLRLMAGLGTDDQKNAPALAWGG
jgi:hypothetical protein